MRIFTGYFGRLREYKEAGLFPIAICITAKFWKGFFYKDFAPKSSYLKLEPEKYEPLFKKDLQKLSPNKVFRDLQNISAGKDIVLLCYETPDKFCHRHLVAKYLEWADPRLTVMEYGVEDILPKEKPKSTQIDLFGNL